MSGFAQLELLNDEFDDAATFSNWSQLNLTEGWNASQLEQVYIDDVDGSLLMQPWTCGWSANRRAPLVFKLVSGDFIFTTQVVITDRDLLDGDHLPTAAYSLAGPMIRIPKSFTNGQTGWNSEQNENYIFLSAGFASNNHNSCPGCPSPHFEVKNTTNGNSVLSISSLNTPITSPITVTIRMVRIGQVIFVLYQLPGQSFIIHRRYYRSNFPAQMQIGFVTYTDWNKVFTYSVSNHNQYTLNTSLNPNLSSNPSMSFSPDLTARFQYARFNEVVIPPALAGVNLFNEATDEQLLSFLGFASTAVLPVTLHNFKAAPLGKKILLNWTTETEHNNRGFELQRSLDGENFVKHIFINGNGTSNRQKDYSYLDRDIIANTTYYYRLKQVDFDGKYSFSKTIKVSITSPQIKVEVFPVPVGDQLNIVIDSPINTRSKIMVYNAYGQEKSQRSIYLNKGNNKIELDTYLWLNGVYTLIIENKDQKEVIRVIK